MSIDYLTDTKTLIQLLANQGNNELADKLQESMDAAATSTELLMRVRHILQSSIDSQLSELAVKRVERLVMGINDILK